MLEDDKAPGSSALLGNFAGLTLIKTRLPLRSTSLMESLLESDMVSIAMCFM